MGPEGTEAAECLLVIELRRRQASEFIWVVILANRAMLFPSLSDKPGSGASLVQTSVQILEKGVGKAIEMI